MCDKKEQPNESKVGILRRTMTGIIDRISGDKIETIKDDNTNDLVTDENKNGVVRDKVTEDITELAVQMALTN